MTRITQTVIAIWLSLLSAGQGADESLLERLEQLAGSDPKPFVLVEARGESTATTGQGVVISPQGHVLTCGHVSWDEKNSRFADRYRISFRDSGQELPEGVVHRHTAVFRDREEAAFEEHFYAAQLLSREGSRFVEGRDLAVLTIDAAGTLPAMNFYSKGKPEIRIGEVFYLCHYSFPRRPADPTFLINPIEVAGVAQTTSGTQYLAKGYYRVGSSGGAILKEGRLIGIQSAAYTVNAKDVGEIPLGLISFQPVWSELVDRHLKPPRRAPAQ